LVRYAIYSSAARSNPVAQPSGGLAPRQHPVLPCRGLRRDSTDASADRTPDEKRCAMTWAQRLRRALLRASCSAPFGPALGCSKSLQAILAGIDITTCVHCGGVVRIVVSVEEPKRDPRHPRPLREARRAGASALPAPASDPPAAAA